MNDHRDTTDIADFCSKVLAGFAVLVQSVSCTVLFLLHAVLLLSSSFNEVANLDLQFFSLFFVSYFSYGFFV